MSAYDDEIYCFFDKHATKKQRSELRVLPIIKMQAHHCRGCRQSFWFIEPRLFLAAPKSIMFAESKEIRLHGIPAMN
jgi:hypothetical protein